MLERFRKFSAVVIGLFALATAGAILVLPPDHPCHPSNDGTWSWWLSGCWMFSSEMVTLAFLVAIVGITAMSFRVPNTPDRLIRKGKTS